VQEIVKREVSRAKTLAEAGAMGGRANKAVDNINGFSSKGGTKAVYLLRRLRALFADPRLFAKVV
jgi:hypothetical protein